MTQSVPRTFAPAAPLRRGPAIATAAVLLVTSVGTAAGAGGDVGCWLDKILASDADALDRFGDQLSIRGDVALDGDDCIVSAVGANVSTGEAHFFRRDDGAWTRVGTVGPVPGELVDQFGFAVDLLARRTWTARGASILPTCSRCSPRGGTRAAPRTSTAAVRWTSPTC